MRTNSRVSPEQRELEAKRAELAQLETELSQRELELTTLQTELRAFEARYLRVVGSRFAQRDDLEAQIAEAVARRRPRDVAANREAEHSRARATQSAEAADSALSMHVNESFEPTDDLKRLFREIAKLVHPDLTTDDRERERRHRAMTAVNQAFAAGDAKGLQRILDDWETSPESVQGKGIGADLIRIIRKIHQVNRRLSQIEEELGELRRSELYDLKERYEAARDLGRDLLAEMADQLDAEIAELKERLDFVLKGVAT
jgi:hypothetical protein